MIKIKIPEFKYSDPLRAVAFLLYDFVHYLPGEFQSSDAENTVYGVRVGVWSFSLEAIADSTNWDTLVIEHDSDMGEEKLAALDIVRNVDGWSLKEQSYTGMVRENTRDGTIFVDTVEAVSANAAVQELVTRAADSWSMSRDLIHCFGVFEGACEVAEWDDDGIEYLAVGTRQLTVDVAFEFEVPVDHPREDDAHITFDVDPALISVHGEKGDIKGGRVTGYTTQEVYDA